MRMAIAVQENEKGKEREGVCVRYGVNWDRCIEKRSGEEEVEKKKWENEMAKIATGWALHYGDEVREKEIKGE